MLNRNVFTCIFFVNIINSGTDFILVFKILFANPKNEKFLKMLLEKVLHAKVDDICYLGTEVYPDNVKNKDMRLDCLVDTNLGVIEIEMNSYNRGYLKIRKSQNSVPLRT